MIKILGAVIGTIVCSTAVFCPLAYAQFSEDFSEGTLAHNGWSGITNHFIINSAGQLQLNNSEASSSYLSVAFDVPLTGNMEWQVFVQLGFAPSANNYARVYLASDQSDLTQSLNGYYLQFGEAGSNDAIELFRQSGNTHVSVCRGIAGAIANAFQARVRVLRDSHGQWQLFADYAGGTDFNLEATGEDAVHQLSSFLGVRCVYTVTNASRFFFDDFYMGLEMADTVPPSVSLVKALSSTELEILFSEKVDANSATLAHNYHVDIGSPHPVHVDLLENERSVHLTFSSNFPNGRNNVLGVHGVRDLSGNEMAPEEKAFMYFEPVAFQPKDVIITEIFADPTPPVSLPEAEFIEILNRSEHPLDLAGSKLTDGNSTGTLSSFILQPGQYLILSPSNAASQFSSFGNTMAVPGFPSLNNAGDAIVLKDPNGQTIDSVNYTDKWYRDSHKKQGGWTLELIDPNNPCGEEDNWTASEDPSGGTPGRQNSVLADKPDRTGPKLVQIIPLNENELRLTFNKKLNRELPLHDNFVLTPALEISSVSFFDPTMRSVKVVLSESMAKGVMYTLTCENIYDCNGNVIQPGHKKGVFGLPEKAMAGDVVLNEILFNPLPLGVDFVEVYNHSNKLINLKNWALANADGDGFRNKRAFITDDHVFWPGHYIVLTTNTEAVKGQYVAAREENFIITTLPSFPDSEGSVVLLDEEDQQIDRFLYHEKMHSPFLRKKEGVSLERVSFSGPTGDPQNWRSASTAVGYATPGYVNSSARPESLFPEDAVKVDPEIFRPVYGQPDFALIQYKFDYAGYVANAKIFDAHGRMIKVIANNEILGTEGFYRWDGDREDGGKARVGYYFVWFEVFNESGTVRTYRKRVVVAGEF